MICPLIGFVVFWMMSRYRVGKNLWRPLVVALLLAVPAGFVALFPAYAIPWVEVARTSLVALLMMWSVGAMRVSKRHTSAA